MKPGQKNSDKPYVSLRNRVMTKAEKQEIAEIKKALLWINKDYIPKPRLNPVNPEEMIMIGNKVHAAMFKKDQAVFWRGNRMYVTELVEPHKNEPNLKTEYQDWGYGLREFNGKSTSVYISESDLKSIDDAAKLGLLQKAS